MDNKMKDGRYYDYAPREFPYKSIEDPEYIKDRDEFFRENGNGWWWKKEMKQGNKTNFTRPNRKKKNKRRKK